MHVAASSWLPACLLTPGFCSLWYLQPSWGGNPGLHTQLPFLLTTLIPFMGEGALPPPPCCAAMFYLWKLWWVFEAASICEEKGSFACILCGSWLHRSCCQILAFLQNEHLVSKWEAILISTEFLNYKINRTEANWLPTLPCHFCSSVCDLTGSHQPLWDALFYFNFFWILVPQIALTSAKSLASNSRNRPEGRALASLKLTRCLPPVLTKPINHCIPWSLSSAGPVQWLPGNNCASSLAPRCCFPMVCVRKFLPPEPNTGLETSRLGGALCSTLLRGSRFPLGRAHEPSFLFPVWINVLSPILSGPPGGHCIIS